MAAKDSEWTSNVVAVPQSPHSIMLNRKRPVSDIQESSAASSSQLDEAAFRKKVLRLSDDQSENEFDLRLAQEAQEYGILRREVGTCAASIESLAASLSATTISSEPHNLSSTQSRMSQSTVPTSCGSSERRPTTQASFASENLASSPTTPSNISTSSKKDRFRLKSGLRRLSTLSKRHSVDGFGEDSSTVYGSHEGSHSKVSLAGSFQSRMSSKSRNKTAFAHDEEAVQRSQLNRDILSLREIQREAAGRFMTFETQARATQKKLHKDELEALEELHSVLKKRKAEEVRRSEEALEERQLRTEEDLRHELDLQKRRALTRLRHMEAYCKGTASPIDSSSEETLSPTTKNLRVVTKQDLDKLTQQYHIVNGIDTLHESKINVLRGQQEQRAMIVMANNEAAIENLADECRKEKEDTIRRHQTEEGQLTQTLLGKRCRMIMRWKLQEEIKRKKLEKETGLPFGPLAPLNFPESRNFSGDGKVLMENPNPAVKVPLGMDGS